MNYSYNLSRLSHDEQMKRYDIINRFVLFNPYFGYLPYISNPTNNYYRYPNSTLETILLELNYGNIEGESVLPEIKKAYMDFAKDYDYNANAYAREQQEKQRILQEQQMAAMQHNTNTQPVTFYGGQNSQYQPQQQGYGQYDPTYANRQTQQPYYPQQQQQPRERRYNNNREQGQYVQPREQRDHQHRDYQGHHQYREVQPQGEYTNGHNSREYGHPNSRERKFHEKRSQEPYQQQYQQYQQYQQVQPFPHQSHPQHQDHEDHHLWHKYHTKSGDIMTFESRTEYEEFLHFKQKYGIEIEVRYDPEDKFHPKPEELIEEQETAAQAIPEPVPEPVVIPQPVPEPVVVPPPEPKPRRFTIEEIKQFINSATKEELEKHVNPEVIAKAAQVRGWASQEVQVEQKEDKRKQHDNKKPMGGDNKGRDIKTGVKRDQSKVAESLGYKPQQSPVVQITIGKNETLETRKIKEDIRKMAGQDFATLKEKELETMDQVEKSRKEIIYNLNLIVPENLGLIEKDIVHFLFEDVNVCRTMIEEIIKKAWDQPKYASTYAKLCSDFCKRQPSEFKFEGAKKEGRKEEAKEGRREKRDNPFKYFLIERVQHSFDQKIEKFPDFESPEDKEIFLKDKKKNILSNVKFIAELIIHKVLKKRTIKYCISQLFESFLRHFHAFKHENKIEDSVYDYHFEAIIEFIENIGEVYEELGEKEKEVQQYDFAAIRAYVGQVLSLKAAPEPATLGQIEYFNGDEYFKLLAFINDSLIRQNFPRLSALLQNLVERRNNKWAKHLSSSEGPKKLKEIQEDILREEDDTQGKGKEKMSKEKMEQEKLDKKVKELFEGWEMSKGEELREIKEILRKTNERTFYFSFLKQVADEKKDNIVKRVALFPVLLNDKFIFADFRQAWFDIIKYLAQGSGDYPFCGAALAQILQLLLEKEGTLGDMWRTYNEDSEEDEVYFIQEVFQKYYHYSKDETALKWVKPKPKLSGLI